METVLEIAGLTKSYGSQRAVDGLSLSVRRGEIYGFLGMNGAGKTTVIRMVLGLVGPDEGSVRLFGETVASARRARGGIRSPGRLSASPLGRVGAMVEVSGFYGNLTARENLEIIVRLSGVHKSDAIGEALGIAGLPDDKKLVGQFSLGMRQRLGLARAIVNHPELIVLDEPLNGLDPAGIRDVRNLVRTLACEHGVAVFMSSHLLSEVDQVSDRIGVIHRGRLVDEVTIPDLRKKNRTYVEFGVSDENRTAMILERELGICDYEIPGNGSVRIFSRTGDAAAINRVLVEAGIGVYRIGESETGLEEYFFGITGGRYDESHTN